MNEDRYIFQVGTGIGRHAVPSITIHTLVKETDKRYYVTGHYEQFFNKDHAGIFTDPAEALAAAIRMTDERIESTRLLLDRLEAARVKFSAQLIEVQIKR